MSPSTQVVQRGFSGKARCLKRTPLVRLLPPDCRNSWPDPSVGQAFVPLAHKLAHAIAVSSNSLAPGWSKHPPFRKPLGVQAPPGFKSLPLRHFSRYVVLGLAASQEKDEQSDNREDEDQDDPNDFRRDPEVFPHDNPVRDDEPDDDPATSAAVARRYTGSSLLP